MIDRDIAELYGVSTKRLNEQLRRNRERFPEDFMFQLTLEEGRALLSSKDRGDWLPLVQWSRRQAPSLQAADKIRYVI